MAANLGSVLNSIASALGSVPASTVTNITGSIVDLVNGNQAQEKNLVVQMEAFGLFFEPMLPLEIPDGDVVQNLK